jgi:RNA polymerase subunit RPABC4/transcription elongation factor Spt4
MSDIFSQLKDGADQVISEVDKLRQTGQSALSVIQERMAESERKRKIKQLQSNLAGLRQQIDQMTAALGVQVTGLYEQGKLSNPELVALCEHISELRGQVKEKEEKLADLQPPPAEAAQATGLAAPVQSGPPCPSCAQPLPPDAAYCPYCGVKTTSPTSPQIRFCAQCGATLRAQARFCPQCGAETLKG